MMCFSESPEKPNNINNKAKQQNGGKEIKSWEKQKDEFTDVQIWLVIYDVRKARESLLAYKNRVNMMPARYNFDTFELEDPNPIFGTCFECRN